MSFDVAADAYTRFMGVYSEVLAARFIELLRVRPGQRALDVGCGPGVLTAPLVDATGADNVAAIDPSTPFVQAVAARFPGVDVHTGSAEALPFPDDTFDVTAAQLVVHFMNDPVAGLIEMRRVTRPGGVVATNVWDHAGGGGPLTTFWRAVHDVDPQAHDEGGLPGTREGQLTQLSSEAGLRDIEPGRLSVTVRFDSFEQWWTPYTLGVGPAGAYVAGLDAPRRTALANACRRRLPAPPFDVEATAWTVIARA